MSEKGRRIDRFEGNLLYIKHNSTSEEVKYNLDVIAALVLGLENELTTQATEGEKSLAKKYSEVTMILRFLDGKNRATFLEILFTAEDPLNYDGEMLPDKLVSDWAAYCFVTEIQKRMV